MTRYNLEKFVTIKKFKYYLEASNHFRFPFYDPDNPYRKNGLFIELEDTLLSIGEKLKQDYGPGLVSINIRGSWLRGIPLEGDDIDILFIIRGLPSGEQRRIMDFSRKVLYKQNPIFNICSGKEEDGIRVDPISFFDMEQTDLIINQFMYGLGRFLSHSIEEGREFPVDPFFGSKFTEKLLNFLKSGILIPYVGWIYGLEAKHEVFNHLGSYLSIPTRKTGIYSEKEIDFTKEIIRQIFIARNLIFPSIKLKKFTDLSEPHTRHLKNEALILYSHLALLERIYARAVVSYIYTANIELKLFQKRFIKNRVSRFAADYDTLVNYILTVKYPDYSSRILLPVTEI